MAMPPTTATDGQQRAAGGHGGEHLARREPDDLEDREVAHALADAEQQGGEQVDQADGQQHRVGAVEHRAQVAALLAHAVLGHLDVELAARRAHERGLHRVRVGAVAQLQLVLHGSEARERGRRDRAAVEDRRPPVVVGLDVAPDDAQVQPRALGLERQAVADVQVAARRAGRARRSPRRGRRSSGRRGPRRAGAGSRRRARAPTRRPGCRAPRPWSPTTVAVPGDLGRLRARAGRACAPARPRWRRRSARRAWRAARSPG